MFNLDSPEDRAAFERTSSLSWWDERKLTGGRRGNGASNVSFTKPRDAWWTCVKCFSSFIDYKTFEKHYCPNSTTQRNHRAVYDHKWSVE